MPVSLKCILKLKCKEKRLTWHKKRERECVCVWEREREREWESERERERRSTHPHSKFLSSPIEHTLYFTPKSSQPLTFLVCSSILTLNYASLAKKHIQDKFTLDVFL